MLKQPLASAKHQENLLILCLPNLKIKFKKTNKLRVVLPLQLVSLTLLHCRLHKLTKKMARINNS